MHYKNLMSLENLELIDFDIQDEINRQEIKLDVKSRRNKQILDKIEALRTIVNNLTNMIARETQKEVYNAAAKEVMNLVLQKSKIIVNKDDNFIAEVLSQTDDKEERNELIKGRIREVASTLFSEEEFNDAITSWIESNPEEVDQIMYNAEKSQKIKELKERRQHAIDRLGLAELDKSAYYDPPILGLRSAIAATVLQIPIHDLDEFGNKMNLYNTKFVPEYLMKADKTIENFGIVGKIYKFLKDF